MTRRCITRLLAPALAGGMLAGPASSQQPTAPGRPGGAANPAERPAWLGLPPTPALPEVARGARVRVRDADLHYWDLGSGEPVLFLHGGLAHSAWWGHQLGVVARQFRVIALDTRGHGGSAPSARPFSFALLAADVTGLLDRLGIARCAIVGWSDGAICGLQIALRAPQRLARLLAYGANFDQTGVRRGGGASPLFVEYGERCRAEHARLSPAPASWPQLVAGLRQMWHSEPTWTRAELGRIRSPVLVVHGEHDEIILRAHSAALAAAIPGAVLTVEPRMSHFGMLQDSQRFTDSVMAFLRG